MFEFPKASVPSKTKPKEESPSSWDDTVPLVVRERVEKTSAERIEQQEALLKEYTAMIGLYEAAQKYAVDILVGSRLPSDVISAEVAKLVAGLSRLPLFSMSDPPELTRQAERLFEGGPDAFEREIQKVQGNKAIAEEHIKALQA